MVRFTIFNLTALLAAILGLFTYGSLQGMIGTFLAFYALGLLALFGFIPFVGIALYFVFALAIVLPELYAFWGFGSSWLMAVIILTHGLVATFISFKMFA